MTDYTITAKQHDADINWVHRGYEKRIYEKFPAQAGYQNINSATHKPKLIFDRITLKPYVVDSYIGQKRVAYFSGKMRIEENLAWFVKRNYCSCVSLNSEKDFCDYCNRNKVIKEFNEQKNKARRANRRNSFVGHTIVVSEKDGKVHEGYLDKINESGHFCMFDHEYGDVIIAEDNIASISRID